MYNTNQFIALYKQVSDIKENNLDMVDVFIYAFLKSYMNKKTKKSIVSLATLSEKTGVSKMTISKSLQILKDLNYINFNTTPNICTSYEFVTSNDGFDKIPYVLLYTNLLNYKEKAYAICIQKYFFNIQFETDAEESDSLINYTLYSPTKLASLLGISDTTALKYTDALQHKGFIIKTRSADRKNSLWVFNYKLLYEESNKIIDQIKEDRDILLQQKDIEIRQHLKTIKLLEEKVTNFERLVENISRENYELRNIKSELEAQKQITEMLQKKLSLNEIN